MTQDASRLTVDAIPVKSGHGGRVLLLRVAGRIDEARAPLLAESLAARTPSVRQALTHVVLDLSGVRLLCPAGARVLAAWADRLAGRCRRVLAAAAVPDVASILYVTRTADVLELSPTVDAALARTSPAGSGAPRETSPKDAELRNLRAQVRTLPLIAQARGMLLERYRLSDGAAAFHLLQESSQRFNVRLCVLACALVSAPRPRSVTGPWFPGRPRTAPPATIFLKRSGADPANRSRVLELLLNEAMEIAGTASADLQLVDSALGVLVLERQRGFSEEFQDFFAHVGDDGTACAARRSGARVIVQDVATEKTAMDALSAEAACWLTWYHRTFVLDALEHLHHRAMAR